jgi:hypothetical protein
MNISRIFLLGSFVLSAIHAEDPAPVPVSSLSCPACETDERNLFKNGNFEQGTAGWELLNWGKDGKMEIDTSELHDGKPTLRVTNSDSCHSFIRQIVKGKANTRYRLSGYIKTKDVASDYHGQKTGAILMVGRMTIYTPLLSGTKPWTAVSVDFNTADDPEIRVGPSLGTDFGYPTGTAWFSDLKLVEIGALSVVIPVPDRAKEFLDPVETLLRSAPADALNKLKDFSQVPEAIGELNHYFAAYALNKSIVLHTTVEAADAYPDVRNRFRIRAASVPLEAEGLRIKRLSWLYFQPADAAEANSVKLGAEITVKGWVRRCEIVLAPEGLRLNFDLQYTRIITAAMPLPDRAENAGPSSATLPGAAASGDEVIKGYTRAGYPVTDLREKLAGTKWQARPGEAVRPGLVPLLTFNGKSVEPADYRYEANAHDSSVTVYFNHGDTQLMLVTDEGKRLRFSFGGRDYSYDLVAR